MPMIHDLEVEEYLHQCVSIDRTDINSEFARVASDLAYWGEQYAQAERAHAEAKNEHEVTHARLYQVYRATLESKAASAVAGTKTKAARITEGQVEAAMMASNEYVVSRQEVVDCETAKTRVKMLIEAVKTKRDMLVSLGAQMRAELRGEPHINDDEKSPGWDDWKDDKTP